MSMTNAILILMIADHFLKIGYPVPLYEIVSKTKKNCAHLDIFIIIIYYLSHRTVHPAIRRRLCQYVAPNIPTLQHICILYSGRIK